jgi:hypothetical protein
LQRRSSVTIPRNDAANVGVHISSPMNRSAHRDSGVPQGILQGMIN